MAWTSPITAFAVHDVLTAAEMNAIGANLNFLKSGVAAFTTNATAVGPTSGTTELVCNSLSMTTDGTTEIELKFTWSDLQKSVATDVFLVMLYDGPTAGSGTLYAASKTTNASGTNTGGGMVRALLTPSAGAHTFTARVARSTGTGTLTVLGTAGSTVLSAVQAN